MAPRSQPTARQVRLGTELRRLREAAGLKAREVAGLLKSTSAQMSQIEAGLAGVSEKRVRRLAAIYGCTDEPYVDALAAMAGDRTRGWWEEYRGVLPSAFMDTAEAEHHATFIREVVILLVPGLLQTADYARAVFSYMRPDLSESGLESRVEHRMRRQAVITGARPTPYETVIHEFALRVHVSDRRASRSQLRLILNRIEEGSAVVRVIPVDYEGFAGAGSSLVYLDGSVPQLDTGVRDAPTGVGYVDEAAQLKRLRALYQTVKKTSLGPTESREFIHRLAKEL
ncbi:MAG TPA: helix-turn-helix transcriptional regulator [Streptomyces sp.]|nr:helix-turn-helix transcriptional regulator [Streptomyces sp.]